MKIFCNHGYFKFLPTAIGEIAKFNSAYETDLVAKDDFYTFTFLQAAPDYSVLTKPYLGVPAIKTYADERPWEIMRQNKTVFNHLLGIVQPINAITLRSDYVKNQPSYGSSKNLYVPGSFTSEWKQITGYNCLFDFSNFNFYYTDIFYE